MYCLILKQENFTSDLNVYEVELWNISSFTKAKGYHRVLRFGSKSSYLGDHGKDKINKKVKSIVFINVFNEFDM